MADYANFDCPECGSQVYDNRQNKRNPKAPDFKCTSCDYVKWPPRGSRNNNSAPQQQRRAAPPQQRAASNGDDRSSRIERQHSQEMALRYAALKEMGDINTTALRELIDWFQRDVGHVPAPPQAKQQRAPEPEPEPDYVGDTPDEAAALDDEVPF